MNARLPVVLPVVSSCLLCVICALALHCTSFAIDSLLTVLVSTGDRGSGIVTVGAVQSEVLLCTRHGPVWEPQ
jgi:hypothetical protein